MKTMSKQSVDPMQHWIRLDKGLYLNKKWLEDGLIVISSHPKFNQHAGEKKLKVNQTTILHKKIVVRKGYDKEYEQKREPLSGSASSSMQPIRFFEESVSRLERVFSFFSALRDFVQKDDPSQSFKFDDSIYFENEENQDVFIPVTFQGTQGQPMQFYVSPSINNLVINQDFFEKFSGIRVFVTAGCLFGAALQGVDKKGSMFPMIQHKIAFVEGDKIVTLDPIDDELHPYEIAQFNFIKDTLPLMESICDKNIQPRLVYHLPSLDYILSAIKLFIQNKISYEALLDFYNAVKVRSQTHVKRINAIFNDSKIVLHLESPFANLLRDFLQEENYKIIWEEELSEFNEKGDINENEIHVTVKDARLIYKILSPSGKLEEGFTDIKCTEHEFPPQNEQEVREQLLEFIIDKGHARGINAFLAFLGVPNQEKPFANQRKLEQTVVANILKALVENEFSIRHQVIWKDFLKINFGKDKINSLEMLFKVANAIVIAAAAKGEIDHSVCSFLPLNEKPILMKYIKCAEQLAQHNIYYPNVLSLVVLERLICYSSFAQGNAFYFYPSPGRLAVDLNEGALKNPKEHYRFFNSFDRNMDSLTTENMFGEGKAASL
jgi:hypothetical protein